MQLTMAHQRENSRGKERSRGDERRLYYRVRRITFKTA